MGKKKSRLFYRYLLSYLLVIVIPLSFLAVWGYSSFLRDINSVNQNYVTEELKNTVAGLDKLRADLQETAIRLSDNIDLSRFMIESSDLGPLTAMKELVKYQSANSSLTDIWLYYRDIPQKIFATDGSWTIDTLFDYIKLADAYRPAAVLEQGQLPAIYAIDRINLSGITPNDYFLYVFAVDNERLTPKGTISFFVEQQAYLADLVSLLQQFDGAAILQDELGQTLTYLDYTGAALPIGEALAILADSSQSDHFIAARSQDNYRINLQVLLNKRLFTASTRQSMQSMIITILLVLSLCIAVALYFAIRNYSPLQSIVRGFDRKYLETVDPRRANELEVIQDTIQKMSAENQDMQSSRRLLDKHILHDLLFSRISPEDNQYITANLQVFRSFLCIAVLDKITDNPMEDILPCNLGRYAAFCLKIGEYDHWAVFLGQDINQKTPDNSADIGAIIDGLRTRLATGAKYVGVGAVHEGLDGIVRSYIEAMAAYNVARSYPDQKVIFYAEPEPNAARSQWYPYYDESRLEQSLLIGHEKLAVEATDSILQYAESWQADPVKARCIVSGIVNTMVRELARLGQNYDDFVRNMENARADSAGRQQYLHAACRVICSLVQKTADERSRREDHKIIQYIQAHFSDPMLSMEQLTGIFDRSESYISRVVKEQSRLTFGDLVWSLRFDEVKRQLTATDKPVKDIVTAVGYIDVSSFIRKFRKSTGITPNDYRTVNRLDGPTSAAV